MSAAYPERFEAGRAASLAGSGLFRGLLGARFAHLDPAVRAVHDGSAQRLVGTASVSRGDSILARALCRLARLPHAQPEAPVRIDIDVSGAGETWTRHFGSSPPMRSRLRAAGGMLLEQLGPLRLRFDLQEERGAVEWRLCAVSVLGIAAPRRWLASTRARSSERHARYCFEVSVTLPLAGLVIAYAGSVDAAPRS